MSNVPPPPPPPFSNPPISYAGRSTGLPSAWTVKRVVSVYVPVLVLLAALHTAMVLLVPRFESIFAEFKLDLPGTTQALFTASRAYGGGGWLIASAGLLLFPLAWVALVQPGRRDRAYRIAITLVTGALVAWIVVGLCVPLIALIDGISSAKGK